jgi:catechol 2,3-dioxygenase-like lactoylglutathione lyase family enzyme
MPNADQLTPVVFEGVTPILRVRDVAASVEYYRSRLGFEVNFYYEGVFASVSRGRCCLFLSQGDQGNPGAWVWVGVGDADELLREYVTSGARIRHQPTNYSWAYEMQVEDLDGNILRMGSEPKQGEPSGEWLDMNGKLWPPVPA